MWKDKVLFYLNTFFSIVYIIWRIFFTIPFGCGIIAVLSGIFLLVVEGLGMVEAFIHFMNMRSANQYRLPVVPEDRFPHVDVFIATYSEEPELLYKTINGCKRMEYPDKSKVHIYLCDDNRRPAMEELARKTGINYLKRPDNRGAKAGNLNNALKHSSSPYVVTFDADMIPQRRFLMCIMPYFVDAEIWNEKRKDSEKIKMGFVQSPQNFYNPDLFQFNLFSEGRIPNEQDYFYKDIQVARTRTNSVIYGGSNTVISREALEKVGGFFTDAITEDFATGILIQKAGYVTLGISDPLASGMSPTDLPNLIQQRIRWGRGVISTGRKMHLYTSKDLSFGQKLNYWASVYYWYAPVKRLIYIMSPLMYATFGFTIFKCTLPQVLAFWLPMYVTTSLSLSKLSGNIRSTKWTGIYETIMFPFMILPIMLETFGISLKKFKVTRKVTISGKQHYGLYMVPFIMLIFLSLIGVVRCIMVIFDGGNMGPIVVLFWMIMNMYYMIMAIMFIDGRAAYRKSERVPLTVPCTFVIDGMEREGTTVDVSEEGLAARFIRPYYLEAGREIPVRLKWEIYSVDLIAKLVYVKQQGDTWMYSMSITDYRDSYDDWLCIIHDRIPPLPSTIKKDSGSFEDLKLNTTKRLATPFFQKRLYPRILLDEEANVVDGEIDKVHVKDFNYLYFNISIIEGPKNLKIALLDDIVFDTTFEHQIHGAGSLYRVNNLEEIIHDETKYYELREYLVKTNIKAQKDVSLIALNHEREQREAQKAERVVFDETKLV
ncbi:glycosyltransferase [Oribacterium sp. WCC10]|uniref:glycosyltransferase n=1 Tax=Oribacterium sp. WCC10 TaxID=1855343 RepID=UPI0008EE06F5|nr:glycosyltransferase [Oribacterium sp. WCC10]SFG75210.1 cellulose synthase (UDP-forming) [Oribacterium sp. WCC10]